jgi:hypothetical protein
MTGIRLGHRTLKTGPSSCKWSLYFLCGDDLTGATRAQRFRKDVAEVLDTYIITYFLWTIYFTWAIDRRLIIPLHRNRSPATISMLRNMTLERRALIPQSDSDREGQGSLFNTT